MTKIRRIVTGHDQNGRSIFVSDEKVAGTKIPSLPTTEIVHLWGADDTHHYPDDGAPQPYEKFFAPVGGYRFLIFTVPPDADNTDTAAAGRADEMEAKFPGLAATFDPQVPGMHRSATIDLLYVMEGRCVSELDSGEKIELHAGDTFVQSGTMHAWRNPFAETCKIIAVIVGAELDR
ncbi:MAG: cupin domain-containing protein [Gammaproteobacteria bacterium]